MIQAGYGWTDNNSTVFPHHLFLWNEHYPSAMDFYQGQQTYPIQFGNILSLNIQKISGTWYTTIYDYNNCHAYYGNISSSMVIIPQQ
jgi:hypothetical protein